MTCDLIPGLQYYSLTGVEFAVCNYGFMLGECGMGRTTAIRNYNGKYDFGFDYFQICIMMSATLN